MVDFIDVNPVAQGRQRKFNERVNQLDLIYADQDRQTARDDRDRRIRIEDEDRAQAKGLDLAYAGAAQAKPEERPAILAQTPGGGAAAYKAQTGYEAAKTDEEDRMMVRGLAALKSGDFQLAQQFFGKTSMQLSPAFWADQRQVKQFDQALTTATLYMANPEMAQEIAGRMLQDPNVTPAQIVSEYGLPSGRVDDYEIQRFIDAYGAEYLGRVSPSTGSVQPIMGSDGQPLRPAPRAGSQARGTLRTQPVTIQTDQGPVTVLVPYQSRYGEPAQWVRGPDDRVVYEFGDEPVAPEAIPAIEAELQKRFPPQAPQQPQAAMKPDGKTPETAFSIEQPKLRQMVQSGIRVAPGFFYNVDGVIYQTMMTTNERGVRGVGFVRVAPNAPASQ